MVIFKIPMGILKILSRLIIENALNTKKTFFYGLQLSYKCHIKILILTFKFTSVYKFRSSHDEKNLTRFKEDIKK